MGAHHGPVDVIGDMVEERRAVAMLESCENAPDKIRLDRHSNSFPEQFGEARRSNGQIQSAGTRYRGATRHKSVEKKMGPVLLPQEPGPVAQTRDRSGGAEGSDYAAFASLQLAQGISCGATLISLAKRTSFQSPGLLPKT
jgi:hypothetical protein